MAKAKTTEKRVVKSMAVIKNKCKDCGVEYEANKIEYTNGSIVITPPRCAACQTRHLTNIRVNKTLKDLTLIGNLKTRLNAEQRQAIVDVLNNGLNEVYQRFTGDVIVSAGFDLMHVKKAD